jgi:hypothetical protein
LADDPELRQGHLPGVVVDGRYRYQGATSNKVYLRPRDAVGTARVGPSVAGQPDLADPQVSRVLD